ncbi:MAG: ParB/RepB/Spo0J family partition protein [Deltaproteobacteria bacterium]|jgi:ParB family chromosome partitioning protein|nr:ParB/RepB/Spo0J family partition protein [Deltaproteobacteria bacterium]
MVGDPKGLSKELSALLQNDFPFKGEYISSTESLTNAKIIPITTIVPNPNQPRKDFEQEAIYDLADSIRIQGLLQPILVRPVSGDLPEQTADQYEIVAGERRWRAAKLAGLTELPVLIKELSTAQSLALSLIENLQREDLNPMEEATGLQRLKEDFGLSQDDLAKQLGKSRSAVANSLRMLTLSENAQKNLRDGKISPGHARSLLAFEDHTERESMRKLILEKKLSVREVEALAYEARMKKARAAQAMTDVEQKISGDAREAAESSSDRPAGSLPEPAVNPPGSPGANLEDISATAPQAAPEELETTRSETDKGERNKKPQSATLMQLQHKLSLAVKLPVKISGRADRGRLSISYSSQAELAQLLTKLGVEENFD